MKTRAAAKKEKEAEMLCKKDRLNAYLKSPNLYRVTRLMDRALKLLGLDKNVEVRGAQKIEHRRRTDFEQNRSQAQAQRRITIDSPAFHPQPVHQPVPASAPAPVHQPTITNIFPTPAPSPVNLPAPTAQTSGEHVWCICRKGSFGNMIACENAKCEIEWYHMDCIGLDSAPGGDWFCSKCAK